MKTQRQSGRKWLIDWVRSSLIVPCTKLLTSTSEHLYSCLTSRRPNWGSSESITHWKARISSSFHQLDAARSNQHRNQENGCYIGFYYTCSNPDYAKSFLYAFFSFSLSSFSRCVILASSVEMAALRLRGSSVARRVLASNKSFLAPSSSFRAAFASARR